MYSWRVSLTILTVATVFMSASYTMLIPFISIFLQRDLLVPEAEVKLWTGAIFSITFLISTVMSPIWGKFSDRHGTKIMAMRASIGLGLVYFLSSIATSPLQMVLIRGFQGFVAGLITVYLTVCSSLVPEEKLGFSLGVINSAQTAGTVLGPLFGGTLATLLGIRASFFTAGLIMIAVSAVYYFCIPDTKPKPKLKTKTVGLLKRPVIRELLSYGCLVRIVMLMIQPVLALYVASLNNNEGNVIFLSGLAFSLVGIASAITSPYWGKWSQQNGFYRGFVYACFLSAITVALCAVPKSLVWFCVFNFIYGLCYAGPYPILNALVALETPKEEQGEAYGYMFSAQQFGSMFGPLLGGLIATYFAMHTIFYACGIIMAGVGTMAYLKHRQEF